MVAIFLGGKLRAGFFRDPVPEDRNLTFEFAGFVVARDPVCDFRGIICLYVKFH